MTKPETVISARSADWCHGRTTRRFRPTMFAFIASMWTT